MMEKLSSIDWFSSIPNQEQPAELGVEDTLEALTSVFGRQMQCVCTVSLAP